MKQWVHLKGRIQFEHVRFSYTDKEVVLPDFVLDIKAGETLALVGHTGAGKSSIAKLIMRFYEFQDGQILIDGRDIRTLDLGQFRLQTGLGAAGAVFILRHSGREYPLRLPDGLQMSDVRRAAMQISQGEWLDVAARMD